MRPIWIVDDDRSIRWVLEKALERASLPSASFADARSALAALDHEAPQILISDIRMPGIDGLELLRELRKRHPQIPVIIMTAYSDLDSAIASFQGGAFDYLAKPFDIDDALALVHRALAASDAGMQDASDTTSVSEPGLRDGMLGQAPAMQELFRAIGRLSASSATVLITGESGSGKELVARALHQSSPRGGQPFVAINTAAIAAELLESELFGHERGAFTGAHARRVGRFEEANGGTLFLDEIGDMPAELQTRLLRVLGDGSFYRVGGVTPIQVDVRVIAATHQPLEERVRQGAFREDLYHRLNVIRLRLPPLRERTEDIELLARHFLADSARELGTVPKQLSRDAIDALMRFSFPGNVRQLQNVCRWLTVMAPSRTIQAADLPPEVRESIDASIPAAPAFVLQRDTGGQGSESGQRDVMTPAPESGASSDPSASRPDAPGARLASSVSWQAIVRTDAIERLNAGHQNIMHDMTREFELALISAALEAAGGKRVDAANRLGLGRNTITRKMRELGIA